MPNWKSIKDIVALYVYISISEHGILNDIEVDGEVTRLLPYLMWRKIITYGWSILNRAFSDAFKQAALLKDVIVILIDISFYAKVYGSDSDHTNQNRHEFEWIQFYVIFSHVTLSLCQNVRNIIDSTYTNIITASMGQNYSFMHDMIFANRKLTEGTGIQPIRLLFTHRPIRSQMDAIWNVFTPKLTDFRHSHVIFPIFSRIFISGTVKVEF